MDRHMILSQTPFTSDAAPVRPAKTTKLPFTQEDIWRLAKDQVRVGWRLSNRLSLKSDVVYVDITDASKFPRLVRGFIGAIKVRLRYVDDSVPDPQPLEPSPRRIAKYAVSYDW